jgi:phenylpropionate dioxygenase-like ring-hydroxylating dioxygenase large terminal subunit
MTTDQWQAVARARDLGQRPLRIMWEEQPVVLFRHAGGIGALLDRCPHRLVPLSGGCVRNGHLECPYHGWQFNAAGDCVAIPGHHGDLPRARIPRFAVAQADGAIFLARNRPAAAPYTHPLAGGDAVTRLVVSQTAGQLLDVVENILDATHTHFTHKGLLRGLTTRRQRVDVTVTGGAGWVAAAYTGETRQDGLVSRLLDGARVKTIGRYRHPGIAELEYWGPKGMVLATTFHLRQATADQVAGIGWLAGPWQRGLGAVKALAFTPLFTIALKQDQRVLSAAAANARLTGGAPLIGPLDYLRKDIAAIMAGDLPSAAHQPRHHQIDL